MAVHKENEGNAKITTAADTDNDVEAMSETAIKLNLKSAFTQPQILKQSQIVIHIMVLPSMTI